jgi:hypothetical protein
MACLPKCRIRGRQFDPHLFAGRRQFDTVELRRLATTAVKIIPSNAESGTLALAASFLSSVRP